MTQRLQDFVEHRLHMHRLAVRIFRWRIAYYARRGQIKSAEVVEVDTGVLFERMLRGEVTAKQYTEAVIAKVKARRASLSSGRER